MMILQNVASGLVFFAGLLGLRLAVVRESWGLLILGLAITATGLAWLFLGGFPGRGRLSGPSGARRLG